MKNIVIIGGSSGTVKIYVKKMRLNLNFYMKAKF